MASHIQPVNDSFAPILGDKRGDKSHPESPLPVTTSEQGFYLKADKIAAWMSLIPWLPAPQPVETWITGGLTEGFGIESEAVKKLGRDFHLRMDTGNQAETVWKSKNPNYPSPGNFAWRTLLNIGSWLFVFDACISEGEREFLELCWQQLAPAIAAPGDTAETLHTRLETIYGK